MGDRRQLSRALLVSALVAALALPAWAAPPASKRTHYPGQDCKNCHKRGGKAGGGVPAGSVPSGGAATGTGSTATPKSGAGPSQGGAPTR